MNTRYLRRRGDLMINRKELAICKRRGHAGGVHEGWTQCKWCKTWLREVRKIEEREDEPPEEELDIRVQSERSLKQFKTDSDQIKSGLDRAKRGREYPSSLPSKRTRKRK
jgi:hypothetical protein